MAADDSRLHLFTRPDDSGGWTVSFQPRIDRRNTEASCLDNGLHSRVISLFRPADLMSVPSARISAANDAPIRADGDYVVYWMTSFRRTKFNFALQHAADRASELGKPLLIFEALRCGYRWASDRMHRFVLEGMKDNQSALSKRNVTYFPYVEPKQNAAAGLLSTLAKSASLIVTDEYPCFFIPHMIETVRGRLPVRLELVDSNGLIPLRSADRTFTVAHSYRRWMHKNILDHLLEAPAKDPLARRKLPQLKGIPTAISRRWPSANLEALLTEDGLSKLPIDHDVRPNPKITGGSVAGEQRLKRFISRHLDDYGEDRNHPDANATSGLSPHLHFGHVSAHQLVSAVLDHEDWAPDRIGDAIGKNLGFWNTSPSAEGLLDQVLTWRELGFNRCFREPRTYDRFESLPSWALATLSEHADDPRPALYDLGEFECAKTHDPIWNAAQRQLVRTGVMHNYMRMLWGKKILHWSRTPEDALATMIELNNKYGIDGRDPNSYSGIFWVLGRFDRAWGPKRPVFGSVRYMTSESAKKKLRMSQYLTQFSA